MEAEPALAPSPFGDVVPPALRFGELVKKLVSLHLPATCQSLGPQLVSQV